MDKLSRVWAIVLATVIIWLCVAVTSIIGGSEFLFGAAAIIALFATVTIWSMWALDYYGISVDNTPSDTAQHTDLEKAKRGTEEDARLALMLALMTPDERETIRARLEDDIAADGEIVSLADLLAEQQRAQDERSA